MYLSICLHSSVSLCLCPSCVSPMIWLWLMFVFHSDANLVFAPETQQNLCGPPVALLNDIVQRYIGQAIKQIFQLLGAVDLFGNPMVLLKHWKTGGKRCAKVNLSIYISSLSIYPSNPSIPPVYLSSYLPISLSSFYISVFFLAYLSFFCLLSINDPSSIDLCMYLLVTTLSLLALYLTTKEAGVAEIAGLFSFSRDEDVFFPQDEYSCLL